MPKPQPETVKGHCLPAPRLTHSAYIVMARVVVLPILSGLFAIDVLLYALLRFGFDQCYGVMCLLP